MLASFSSTSFPILAWTGAGILTTLLSIVVFIVGILLTLVILVQDSKDTGLTSAFGGSGGGSALLGARMQKELARITTILALTLSISLLIIGFITAKTRDSSVGGIDANPLPAGTLPGAEEPGGDASVLPGTGAGEGAAPEASFPIGAPTGTTPPAGGAAPVIPPAPPTPTPSTTPAPAPTPEATAPAPATGGATAPAEAPAASAPSAPATPSAPAAETAPAPGAAPAGAAPTGTPPAETAPAEPGSP